MQPLISAQQLFTAGTDRYVILDCRFDLGDPSAGEDAYSAGHIAGAHYAHLDRDLSGSPNASSGRHPLPERAAWARTVGGWGVKPGTPVVVYDASGGTLAARAWWLMHWLGHHDVALLDGGLNAWQTAGYPLTDEPAALQPGDLYPYTNSPHVMTADEQDILDNIGQQSFALIDARSSSRFIGAEEPIDPVAGHIPGALNRPCTDNLQADGYFKSAPQLREEWQGILADQPCVVMCGSGITACHHLVALAVAGLPPGRLYPGSWSGWITDPRRPIATVEQAPDHD